MKKRIINLLAAILVITTASFASNTPTIKTDGSKAIIVDTKNWKSKILTVEIINDDGKLIYDNELTMINAKKFNFEALENGVYTVTLSDDFKSTTQEIEINDHRIDLIADVKTTYKPLIKIENEFIDVNFMDKSGTATISLHDTNKNVFDVKLNNENALSKRIKTSELPSGSYTIYVNTDTESYWKTFKK